MLLAMTTAFNPAEAVTFDLQFGHIHLDGAPTRVMVPADAVVALCQAAGEEETSAFGHAIGEAVGRRVGVRLAGGSANRHDAARKAGIETVISQLAGELAVLGIGSAKAERWGKALVLVVDQSPFGEGGDGLLTQILESAIRALVDRPARVVRLHREGTRARFLTLSGAAVAGVKERLDAGENWGSVIASLNQPAVEAAP
jgi:hypothetical protein